MSDLTRLEAACAGLTELPDLDGTADYVGRLDAVIRSLQGHRKMVMSEVSGPTTGREYRIATSNRAVRSYNTAAILHRFGEKDWQLGDLIRSGAVKLGWQWTALNVAVRTAGVDMTIAQRELVEDGDIEAPMVGEVWKSDLRVEGVS